VKFLGEADKCGFRAVRYSRQYQAINGGTLRFSRGQFHGSDSRQRRQRGEQPAPRLAKGAGCDSIGVSRASEDATSVFLLCARHRRTGDDVRHGGSAWGASASHARRDAAMRADRACEGGYAKKAHWSRKNTTNSARCSSDSKSRRTSRVRGKRRASSGSYGQNSANWSTGSRRCVPTTGTCERRRSHSRLLGMRSRVASRFAGGSGMRHV